MKNVLAHLTGVNLDRMHVKQSRKDKKNEAYVIANRMQVVVFRKDTIPLTELSEGILDLVVAEFVYHDSTDEIIDDFANWIKIQYPRTTGVEMKHERN